MLYDSVMRNIKNRHKRIKQVNSFINAGFQRNLRTFVKNPLSGSPVLGLESHFQGFGSRFPDSTSGLGPGSRVSSPTFRVPRPTYELGPRSRVSDPTNSPGSQVPLFGYANILRKFSCISFLFKPPQYMCKLHNQKYKKIEVRLAPRYIKDTWNS